MKNSWGEDWGGEGGYIRMERNVASISGKCGIAIEPSYPIKTSQNPPNPGPTPPSPPGPSLVVCDEYYTCPEGNTCCCVFGFSIECLSYGCCPYENGSCCDDHESCCPHDYPICDLAADECLMVTLKTPFLVFICICNCAASVT